MPEINYSDWYIKFAPKQLDEVFAQNAIVKYIGDRQKDQQFDKSVLLKGDFGSGKTILAKILAKSIACKNTDKDGKPCDNCPTCNAINNETWGRDVLYLNGRSDRVDSVRDNLELFTRTMAMKDRAKVIIMDELQALSPEGLEAFLIATQMPRPGQFFIFCAMDKLQGQKGGAIESRCKKWTLKQPSQVDVYNYLVSFYKLHKDIIDINKAPKDFWTKGLEFIAGNCSYSLREAIQLFDQCYRGELFTVEDIKNACNIVSYEDTSSMMADLCEGIINDNVFQTIIGKEYQDKFPLLLKVLSDAEVYRAFGKVTDEEHLKWQETTPKRIAQGQYFSLVKDAFRKLAGMSYIKRGEFQLMMAEIVCQINENKKESPPTRKVSRSAVK